MRSPRRSGAPASLQAATFSLLPFAGLLAFAACSARPGGVIAASPGDADASSGVDDAGAASSTIDGGDGGDGGDAAPSCGADALPTSLACTGLYLDIAGKTIAPGVRAFTPAVPLWSDGSGKNRWVFLPPGQTIDRSAPNDWVFPIGTKFWKEFTRDGQRKETRFFKKQSDGTWLRVSYVWNADESAATATPNGAALPLEDGATYLVPSQSQCDQCHNGRAEHIMGFEEVSLGSSGAAGVTLATLASEGLLSPAPTRTSLTIADDGSGDVMHTLGWLHINCGVPCHNSGAAAGGSGVDMRLRLDATELDGRSARGMDPVVTTVGVPTSTGLWGALNLIQPGDPDDSLLVYLVSTRALGRQMPPLASTEVDLPDVAILRDWITKMAPALDGGASDAGDDAAGVADAGLDGPVSGPVDAATGANDASNNDSGANDASGNQD